MDALFCDRLTSATPPPPIPFLCVCVNIYIYTLVPCLRQVTDWELDQTSIVLDYPPIFLPEEFITDMLRNAINASTDFANAFLFAHPYVLPEGFRARVPDPEIHLRHQDGCCDGIHGFVEITSQCACDPSIPHMPPCGGTTCAMAANPMNEARTRAPFFAFNTARTTSQASVAVDDTGGIIWATIFAPVNRTNAAFASQGCRLDAVGDRSVTLPLASTAGTCQPLPVVLSETLFGFDVNTRGMNFTYALSQHANGTISLQMLCYSYAEPGSAPIAGGCDACVHTITPSITGTLSVVRGVVTYLECSHPDKHAMFLVVVV
jgi:hypothetical protein